MRNEHNALVMAGAVAIEPLNGIVSVSKCLVQCVWRVLYIFALGRHNAFEEALGSHSPTRRATLLICPPREGAVGGRQEREIGGTMSVA